MAALARGDRADRRGSARAGRAVSSDPLRRLGPIVRLAPAKLNLTLAVVGRRPDGYHAIHSVMARLDLADRVSLAPAARGPDTLHVDGFPPGPAADNLVLRAIAAVRAALARAPLSTPALAVRLDKRIPVAAGLGGGSADAAAALEGALEAWGATDHLEPPRLTEIAASLGSDVPFFLVGRTALAEGRGERLTPLRGHVGASPGVLLVTPAIHLATSDVFAAFATGGRAAAPAPGATRLASAHLASELRAGLSAVALVARAGVLASANDLAAAAGVVAPDLVPLRRALTRLLGRPVGLSGSGPTLWALYPSLEAARASADVVRAAASAGSLAGAAGGEPFVAATTIETPAEDVPAGSSQAAEEGRTA